MQKGGRRCALLIDSGCARAKGNRCGRDDADADANVDGGKACSQVRK